MKYLILTNIRTCACNLSPSIYAFPASLVNQLPLSLLLIHSIPYTLSLSPLFMFTAIGPSPEVSMRAGSGVKKEWLLFLQLAPSTTTGFYVGSKNSFDPLSETDKVISDGCLVEGDLHFC